MRIKLLIFTFLFFPSIANAQLEYLGFIPLKCEDVKSVLSKIQTPNNFSIPVVEAHKLSVTGTIIKKCASKLKQVIYHDNEYYYFTNDVFLAYPGWAENKVVKVHGKTGLVVNAFKSF